MKKTATGLKSRDITPIVTAARSAFRSTKPIFDHLIAKRALMSGKTIEPRELPTNTAISVASKEYMRALTMKIIIAVIPMVLFI